LHKILSLPDQAKEPKMLNRKGKSGSVSEPGFSMLEMCHIRPGLPVNRALQVVQSSSGRSSSA
jgi:hypothetical protein